MSCNFLFLFSCVCSVMALAQSMTFQSEIEPEKLVDIRNYLKKINKPAVKTIKSPDGDLIDCVLFHEQPAFDNPLLQGHKPITTDLPAFPKGYNNSHALEEVFQVWRMSGESCPENTIPIRRTTEEDVLRAGSVQTFGRKRYDDKKTTAEGTGHEHAIVYKTDDRFYGAETFINVWHSYVENRGEFSLGQIWVMAGSISDGNLNSIEVGSIVEYGDKYPRLFVYWTSDAYKSTGCYNLVCSGFVQITHKPHVALGAALSPFSAYNGKQFEIRCTVWKAPEDQNWWLAVQGKHVGYWPPSLFPLLQNNADTVEFGGEIVNSGNGGHHTSTQMGSGHFSNEGFGKAALMRNLQLVNPANHLFQAQNLDTYTGNPKCYSTQLGASKEWGTYLYYGGPGRNAPGCT